MRTTPQATGTSSSPASGAQLPVRSAELGRLHDHRGGEPVALSVASVGIHGPVVAVGTDATTGLLNVPAGTSTIAWWAYGSRPGLAHGPVVLAAHVDYDGVRGLFFPLDRTPVGAVVTVRLRSGRSVAYRVDGRQHVSKSGLSALGVFRSGGAPRLVLITCGGSYDAATHHYRDNIVVTAHPVR